MPGLCAAVGCNNRSVRQEEDVDPGRQRRSFHKFPIKNEKLLKQWVHNLKRGEFTPTEHHILCSDHFADDCFEIGFRLKVGCLLYC